jgi:nickel-dependent lactate racemase
MQGCDLCLPWGKDEIQFALPADWQVAGMPQPAALTPAQDPIAEVGRSLAQPIGSPRLRDVAQPDMKVALVIDDSSRPTPVNLILPAVLGEMEQAGVKRASISLVTALGLHRSMAEEEIAGRVGPAVLAGLHWQNHNCDDMEQLAFLGTTRRGTPVFFNRTVAGADLIVCVGCIEPHIIASFGGGYKNLLPGVAGRATVAHNHALNCRPDTFNMVGQPIQNNPMRLDLEEGAAMLKPPVFIVNAVLNSALQIVKVVSGDPIAAHRAGVRTSAQLYGAPVSRPADVVITDSHPMDQDLRQGVKSLANAIRAVRPGGVLITLARAEEGVGVFGLADRRLPLGRGSLRALAPLLLRLVPRLKIQGMGEEDRFFLYFALQAMRHCTMLLYAPTIPERVRANLPFVEFVDSPRQAISQARQRLEGGDQVLVFPHGGTTYPILDS